MKVFAQFYDNRPEQAPSTFNPKPKNWYIEQMGSDQVFILDGRNTMETMVQDTVERSRKLINTPAAFRIMKTNDGHISNAIPLTSIISL